jgi:hypothetical protein
MLHAQHVAAQVRTLREADERISHERDSTFGEMQRELDAQAAPT